MCVSCVFVCAALIGLVSSFVPLLPSSKSAMLAQLEDAIQELWVPRNVDELSDSSSEGMPDLVSKCRRVFHTDAMPRLSVPVPKQQCGNQPQMVEVFAGSGHLAKAFFGGGWGAKTVELACGQDVLDNTFYYDVLVPDVEKSDYTHFGFPCASHSPCRWPKIRTRGEPMGVTSRPLTLKEQTDLQTSNELLFRAKKLIQIANRKKAHWSIENPHASTLWHTPTIAGIITETEQIRGRPQYYTFDMCRYGEIYRKRTRVLSTQNLSALEKRCLCVGPHAAVLSGWRRSPDDQCVPSSSGAQYSHRLCECWQGCFE